MWRLRNHHSATYHPWHLRSLIPYLPKLANGTIVSLTKNSNSAVSEPSQSNKQYDFIDQACVGVWVSIKIGIQSPFWYLLDHSQQKALSLIVNHGEIVNDFQSGHTLEAEHTSTFVHLNNHARLIDNFESDFIEQSSFVLITTMTSRFPDANNF